MIENVQPPGLPIYNGRIYLLSGPSRKILPAPAPEALGVTQPIYLLINISEDDFFFF